MEDGRIDFLQIQNIIFDGLGSPKEAPFLQAIKIFTKYCRGRKLRFVLGYVALFKDIFYTAYYCNVLYFILYCVIVS